MPISHHPQAGGHLSQCITVLATGLKQPACILVKNVATWHQRKSLFLATIDVYSRGMMGSVVQNKGIQ